MTTHPGSGGGRRERQRGSMLLGSIVIGLILMASAAALVTNTFYQHVAERARVESGRAEQIAETGLDVAHYEVLTGTDVTKDAVGVASGAADGGTYSVTIAPAFVGPGTYTLTSIGKYGTRRQTVQRVVSEDLPKTMGFVGLNGITVSSGPSIDSYDSTKGTYASQVVGTHAGSQAKVDSNKNIATGNKGFLWGDATPGPTGTYTGAMKVSGSTAPAKSLIVAPPFVYSPPSVTKAVLNGSATLTSGTYHYKSISLKNNANLTLTGNVTIYCDGAAKFDGGSLITVTPGSNVVFNHGAGDLYFGGQGVVNKNGLPATFQVNSASSTTVTYCGGFNFFGVVNSPNADFNLSGGADYFGAVLAKTITYGSAKGWFHYDTSLKSTIPAGFKVLMERGW